MATLADLGLGGEMPTLDQMGSYTPPYARVMDTQFPFGDQRAMPPMSTMDFMRNYGANTTTAPAGGVPYAAPPTAGAPLDLAPPPQAVQPPQQQQAPMWQRFLAGLKAQPRRQVPQIPALQLGAAPHLGLIGRGVRGV